jgi:hypothetical protein
MQQFKRFLDFYINSSIHVALAVCSLSWITLIEFNLAFDKNLILFTFFATISGYNFIKYFGLAKFHHRRLCFVPLVYFTFQLEQKTLIYLAILGLVTFFYAIPFLPKKIFIEGDANLRAISGLKIYVIAIVWAFVTVVVPLINGNQEISNDAIITSIQRFLYVMVAMLPFEIRDMNFDSLKLGTIPQRIGIRRTKLIGFLLLIPFFFLEYLKDVVQSESIIVLLIVLVLLTIVLMISNYKQSKYFSGFWVEGVPLIWLLFALLIFK